MQESPFYQRVMQRGIEQGIEQGATRATRDAVLKLLHHRFGDVPESIANHITGLRHISQLEAFFEKVMNAETLDDIQE